MLGLHNYHACGGRVTQITDHRQCDVLPHPPPLQAKAAVERERLRQPGPAAAGGELGLPFASWAKAAMSKPPKEMPAPYSFPPPGGGSADAEQQLGKPHPQQLASYCS